MVKVIAGFPVRFPPFEIVVSLDGSPTEGYASLARRVLVEVRNELELKDIFYVVFDTGTLINPYEVINGKFFGRCQVGHTRYYTPDGTVLQGKAQRALVNEAWQEQLSNEKELIEHLTERNKGEVILRLLTYAKHLRDDEKLHLLNQFIQDSELDTLKEIALTFVKFLSLKVKVDDARVTEEHRCREKVHAQSVTNNGLFND